MTALSRRRCHRHVAPVVGQPVCYASVDTTIFSCRCFLVVRHRQQFFRMSANANCATWLVVDVTCFVCLFYRRNFHDLFPLTPLFYRRLGVDGDNDTACLIVGVLSSIRRSFHCLALHLPVRDSRSFTLCPLRCTGLRRRQCQRRLGNIQPAAQRDRPCGQGHALAAEGRRQHQRPAEGWLVDGGGRLAIQPLEAPAPGMANKRAADDISSDMLLRCA